MKKLIAILLCLCQPSWATWTTVQHKATASPGSAACAVTVTALGAGNALVAIGGFPASGGTLNSTPTNGCAVAWVHCTNCAATTASNSSDIYYCLNSASGVTSITVNGSATLDNCEVMEFSTTSGPPLLDIGGARNEGTTPTSCAGVTLSLSGSNDAIVQSDNTGAVSAITSPYSPILDTPNSNGYAAAINTNSGTAPTWTQTATVSSLSALALKETTAGGAVCSRPFCGVLQ